VIRSDKAGGGPQSYGDNGTDMPDTELDPKGKVRADGRRDYANLTALRAVLRAAEDLTDTLDDGAEVEEVSENLRRALSLVGGLLRSE
jgi:hypothetical protein